MVADHLVYAGREDIGGDGDYLQYDQDQTSCISARRRGLRVVELGEDFWRSRGNDLGKVP